MTPGSIVRIAILLAVLLPATGFALYRLRVEPAGMDSAAESQLASSSKIAPSSQSAATRTVNQTAAWNRLIAANFAGDQACAECHPQEYEAHQRSGHSQTLTRMNESELAKQLAEKETYDDPLRPQSFRFVQGDDKFSVSAVNHPQLPELPVTWLLGSGTHAQTPIAVDEQQQQGVEMRWSYLASRDGLGVTPDHARFQAFREGTLECYGRPMDAADVRACLGCHATITPPAQLPIRDELIVPNVGCERCHGPRKQHVILAHQGRAEEVPPFIRHDSAESYLDACSQCHRDESQVSPHASPHELVRFQPYGLKRSRCFLESGEQLICSACHDPHDAVSHDRARYIEQCQQCHQPEQAAECSQQASGDCIACHMPEVEWTSGVAFHDHWIRIRGDGELPTSTKQESNR